MVEQENQFEEIHILMKKTYIKHHGDPFADLKQELEREMQELDSEGKKRLKKVEKDFDNPLGEI